MSTAQTTKTVLEHLATCLDEMGKVRAELTASVDGILAFQRTINQDLHDANAQMVATNIKLFEQLKALPVRPHAAFVLSVDPILGVDIHFSTEVLTQATKDMAPGLQRFAQKMEAFLQQHMPVAAKPKPSKKKTVTSKNAKTKKAR